MCPSLSDFQTSAILISRFIRETLGKIVDQGGVLEFDPLCNNWQNRPASIIQLRYRKTKLGRI